MKGNCVDANDEAPSFWDSFGLDRATEPRPKVMRLVGFHEGVCVCVCGT